MGKIGEILKGARLGKKITLEQVYQATRIPLYILSALEEEKFDKLAGGIYVKSFLKKYAEYLGLNSTEIINSYLATLSEYAPSTPPINVSSKRTILLQGLSKKFVLKFVLGLVSIFLFFLLSRIIFHGLIDLRIKNKERQSPKIKIEEESLLVPLKEELVLKISAKKDTWIQLKADGKIVSQYILKGGTEEIWRAKKGFELWLGDVKNVFLSLNNKPLEIKGEGTQKGILIDHQGLHKN